MAKGDFRRAFTMHLRNFDLRVTELRRMYALLSAEERKQLRAWMEKLNDLEDECPINDIYVMLHTATDEFDEQGKQVHSGDVELTPWTMLQAFDAWDKGETFTPDSIMP